MNVYTAQDFLNKQLLTRLHLSLFGPNIPDNSVFGTGPESCTVAADFNSTSVVKLIVAVSVAFSELEVAIFTRYSSALLLIIMQSK